MARTFAIALKLKISIFSEMGPNASFCNSVLYFLSCINKLET